MIIKKRYKFYAAHRNQCLEGKCSNIHGHRYGIEVFFRVFRNGAITTLFDDFDRQLEPHFKQVYDHGMLIDSNDPLYKYLEQFGQETGQHLKLIVMDGPTSVENLCQRLFGDIIEMGFDVDRIEIQETDSSTVIYTEADWLNDITNSVPGDL